jgi:hypothetical protein
MGAVTYSIDEKLLRFLTREIGAEIFVETGTYRGDSLAIAHPCFPECHSVELSPELYQAAVARFEGTPGLHLHLGSSPEVLIGLRSRRQEQPVVYWLDAHWCAVDQSAGEDAQSPLLEELEAIGHLHADSTVLIDDARLYLCTPPEPHRISDWPDLHDVLPALQSIGNGHRLTVFNDVIVFYPARIAAAMSLHIREQAVDWLELSRAARICWKVGLRRPLRALGRWLRW